MVKFSELLAFLFTYGWKCRNKYEVASIAYFHFPTSLLSKSFDITDIEKKLGTYIPKKLERSIIPVYFKGEEHPDLEDKFFLVVIVEFNPRYIPFISLKGGESLQRDTVYIRRNRASEPINHDELQEILNNRIETEYSTTNERKLIEHLEELKELYNHTPFPV